jgi:predicted ABC-type ATPase
VAKRLRIFAGPNGSGKTTFIQNFYFPSDPSIKLGAYVNADDIEQALTQSHKLPLNDFGLSFDTQQLQNYLKQSTFAPVKLNNKKLWQDFIVDNNQLVVS